MPITNVKQWWGKLTLQNVHKTFTSPILVQLQQSC